MHANNGEKTSAPEGHAGAVHNVNQAAGGGHQEVAAALQLAQLRGEGWRAMNASAQCKEGAEGGRQFARLRERGSRRSDEEQHSRLQCATDTCNALKHAQLRLPTASSTAQPASNQLLSVLSIVLCALPSPTSAHLLLLRGAAIHDHGAHARLVSELAALVVNLRQPARRDRVVSGRRACATAGHGWQGL